jgi:hypothetical protein
MVKLAMELRDPRRKVGCFRAVICSFSAENNEISDISRCRAGVSFRGRTLPGNAYLAHQNAKVGRSNLNDLQEA